MSTRPRTELERELTKHTGFLRTAAGPIQQVASRTCDLLPTVSAVAEILNPGLDLGDTLGRLLVCLEIGVSLDAAAFASVVGRRLTRAQYLALQDHGYASLEAFTAADDSDLAAVIGSDRVSAVRSVLEVHAELGAPLADDPAAADAA